MINGRFNILILNRRNLHNANGLTNVDREKHDFICNENQFTHLVLFNRDN